jgi:Uma2 family endonuclease
VASTVDIAGLHRLSSAEYHQLIESGGLEEGARVELIDGLLCDMSPKTPEHERVIEHLNTLLARALDHDRYRLRPSGPITIGDSEPEPDFAVVERGTPEPYHPAGAKLVIEVSVSSRRRDLEVKPRLYAAAGVEEYWVIDVGRRCAVVHRRPGSDGYEEITVLGSSDALEGSLVGVGRIDLEAVLAAAESPQAL